MLRFTTPFLLFVSWFTSLFISLSVPIIHSIYLWDVKLYASNSLLNISSANVSTNVRFGLWGYCIGQIGGSVAGISDSSHARCTRAALGLHVDPTLARVMNIQRPESTLNKTLSSILVLHPVTCVLTVFAFLAALHAAMRQSHAASVATLLFGGLATLTGTFVFIFDLIIVAASRRGLKKSTDSTLDVTWGNAVWMSLGAIVGLWAACVSTYCAIRRSKRQRDWVTKYW